MFSNRVVSDRTRRIGGVGGGRRRDADAGAGDGLPAQQEALAAVRAVRVEHDAQSVGAGELRSRQVGTTVATELRRRALVFQLKYHIISHQGFAVRPLPREPRGHRCITKVSQRETQKSSNVKSLTKIE